MRVIAERSAQDGVEPLLAKFAGLSKSLNLGTTLGVAGAVRFWCFCALVSCMARPSCLAPDGLALQVAACIGLEQLLGSMVVRMLLAKGIGFSFWLTNPPARLQAVDIFAMQVHACPSPRFHFAVHGVRGNSTHLFLASL